MKLLLIHQAFVGPDGAGGTRHFEFARQLVETGNEVTIVASDVSYLTGRRVTPAGATRVEVSGGVEIRRARTLGVLHRSFVWRVISFLSFMASSLVCGLRAGRVDLVMGTSPPLFQVLSAWLVAAVRRRPLLLEVRDLWPEFAIDMGVLKCGALIVLSRLLERFLYSRADHLLVNSPAYREYLLAKGITPERISLIPNGADPEMFDLSADGVKFREEWGSGSKFVVVYAGALGMANDIPTLLEAGRLLRGSEVQLVLLGDGKERANLERMALELDLDNVHFAGTVPKDQIPAALSAGDAGVAILQDIPMFRTTYPNKVFDYMAAGRPVILAIDGVIREAVEEAGAGVYATPGNPKALARAISEVAALPDRGRAMGAAGRRAVEARFNRRIQALEFRKLVEKLAAV